MTTITEKTSRMYNPAHPGEILREMYLKPLGVTVTQAAAALGVTRKHVSAIVNGRAAVTPDMALRLALNLAHCLENLLPLEQKQALNLERCRVKELLLVISLRPQVLC